MRRSNWVAHCLAQCLTIFLLLQGSGASANVEADFVRAREAYLARDTLRFERYAADIPAAHALFPYIAYWRLHQGARLGSDDRVTDFLAAYSGTWLAERLRGEWLKDLGRRALWPAYLAEFPRLASPDVTHLCYARRAEFAAGDRRRLRDAIGLWFTGRDMPAPCDALFAQLIREGLINPEDLWRRQRLALEAGNVRVALSIARTLPMDERLSEALLEQATRAPRQLLARQILRLDRRADRETALYALGQLARTESAPAESALTALLPQLSPDDRRYAWGQLAVQAARRHEAAALIWFERAGNVALTDPQREWWARAALRAGQWQSLARVIERMSDARQALPVWRYWRGRAYQAQDQMTRARQLLLPLSREPVYYGQLALEELGGVAGNSVINIKPDGDELDAVLRDPAIARAMALYRIGWRSAATWEWNWAIRGFGDRQLLAAAEQARRVGWFDQAINTAERTREAHDFELRFIAPYRALASAHAARYQLDEAWVYGLMRQESRFIDAARSGVGAAGLMQVMPATARWIAQRLGIKRFDARDMHEPETNIHFGTYYLNHIRDRLDGSEVLATAAYNAGPGRAQRWRGDAAMEAAIYIETIPFLETREYVQKVMSNALFYAARFGQPSQLLKDRLGTIPPRVRAAAPAEADTPSRPVAADASES